MIRNRLGLIEVFLFKKGINFGVVEKIVLMNSEELGNLIVNFYFVLFMNMVD